MGAASVHPSPHVAEKIGQLISLKAAKHYRYPFSESERSDLAARQQNQIELGTTFTGSSYTLDADDFTKHLLVVGTTGMGKTTLFYHLMDELPVPYWTFDLKTDYRHLRRRNPDLVVVPWTELQLNPLQPPPQVRPRTWAQTVLELIGDSYSLYSGSQNYLLPIVIDMYQEHDIDVDTGYSQEEVADLPWPRFPQLRAYLQQSGKTGASRIQLRNRLIDRFGSILAATGDLYTESHGYPLAALLDRDVVFELQGLKTEHQDFIIELLLTWVFRYRQAQQQRDEGLQHAFVLDEGKRAFSIYKERDDTKGLPQIDVLTAQLREFGEALLVGDQEPNKLTDALRTNTGTTALFRIEEGEQFRAMADSLQLSERQRSFADRLDVGQAIVKSGGGDAVPVQFPDMDVEKTVTDAELRADLQSVWRDLANDTPVGSTAASTGNSAVETAETGADTDIEREKQPELADVSEEAVYLLKDIARNPNRTLMERYEDLFSYDKKGVRAKQELFEAGLVDETEVRVPEGTAKVVYVTDRGETLLNDEGVDMTKRGRGGPVHRYFQFRIRDAFQQNGWDAAVERHDADVFAEHPESGRAIAVEVAMEARDREVEHVRDRRTVADEVWVACRNDVVRSKLRQQLQENDLLTADVRVDLFTAVTDVSSYL